MNKLYNNDKREIRMTAFPRLKLKFDKCCKYVD